MCQHFNIGKKVEVNPFENVQFVLVSNEAVSPVIGEIRKFLNNKATTVETRKISGEFKILFDVTLLNFTTLLKWLAPMRGIFWFNNKSIHFSIENDIMSLW